MKLPTGTVTFLFTDVEGSTQLWEREPAAMRGALADHDALLRAAVESHHGAVFKTVGDAFCAAFVRPEDALAAAVAAQRSLSQHPWPGPIERMRVRMGIHTGTAVEAGGDYFGPTVNRVARLMSIGHGEQILVSSTSALLLRDVLPEHTSLRDLGSQRLKGLTQPETAYQVVAEDLRADFPALRSLEAHAKAPVTVHNLPLPLTTFYGRDNELATLAAELRDHRLVTLVGFGGVGKTRTSIEAGWHLLDRFPDGVFLIELAPLSDPNLVAARIASALGVPAQTGQLAGDLWIDALREKRTLLILDNCEHVLDAVSHITHRLLQRCPDFRVLATSREPLRLPGERVVRIAPLPLPALGHDGVALGSIRDVPAVSLFLDRVSNTAPEFAIADDDAATWEAVGNVCARLDGIPLALELAAARVSTLGLPRLVAGLDNRFRLLTGGARTSLPRQQTLQATLDWSYAVLVHDEQRVFNRLGVFAGTFTAEAAAAVCSTSEIAEEDVFGIVASLVDKSLVVADGNGPTPRFHLLETTRAYALQRATEHSDLLAARRRHAEYYQTLSLRSKLTFGTGSFEEWSAAYEAEVDNFRAALAWTIEERGDVLLGATILCELKRLFEWLTLNGEVLSWCDRALAALGSDAPPALEAELLVIATRHHMALGSFHAAIARTRRAVELLRGLGGGLPLAFGLTYLGRSLASQPESREEADRALDEALALHAAAGAHAVVSDPQSAEMELSRVLLAILASAFKAFTIDPAQIDRRRAYLADAVAQYRTLSPGHFIIGVMLDNLSELELEAGNYERALDYARESLDFYHRPGSAFGYIWALNAAGSATLALGDIDAARRHASELLSSARRIGSAPGLGMALLLLAAIEAVGGDHVLAAGLLGAWETCAGKIDTPASTTKYLCERTSRTLRETLDDAALANATAAGTRWSIEDAISVALVVAEGR